MSARPRVKERRESRVTPTERLGSSEFSLGGRHGGDQLLQEPVG
jgi:hypothetical protein